MSMSCGVNIDFSPVKLFNVIREENKACDLVSLNLNNIAHCIPSETGKRQKCIEEGCKVISNSKTAVVIMAGGQATRLGAECPKMAFKFNLGNRETCLAEILLQRALSVGKHARKISRKQSSVSDDFDAAIEIIFMLSPSVEKASKTFLEQNNYFGYPKEKISFIVQGVYPCINEQGEVLCGLNGDPIYSPNGNGGFYGCLFDNNILNKLNDKGVKYIHVMGVDNPLAVPSCPGSIGLMELNNLEIVNKMIERDVGEKAGVLGLRSVNPKWQVPFLRDNSTKNNDNKEWEDLVVKNLNCDLAPTILEYSELPLESDGKESQSIMKDYPYANIANHFYSIKFLLRLQKLYETVGKQALLPYHLAFKKVPFAKNGCIVNPTEPNAYKFEHFIFDVFHFCPLNKFGVYIVDRTHEFAPIKNKTGVDSVETAVAAYKKYYKLVSEPNQNIISLPDKFIKILAEGQ